MRFLPCAGWGSTFSPTPTSPGRLSRWRGSGGGRWSLKWEQARGTLTRALSAAGGHVVAYEVDRGLEPVLSEVTSGLDVELRIADVMDADLATDLGDGKWSLVANLPYNVGTPLVLDALRRAPDIERFVVMVQREVADRLVAAPGSRDYGLPSVIVGIHADARLEFTVPPQVILPTAESRVGCCRDGSGAGAAGLGTGYRIRCCCFQPATQDAETIT